MLTKVLLILCVLVGVVHGFRPVYVKRFPLSSSRSMGMSLETQCKEKSVSVEIRHHILSGFYGLASAAATATAAVSFAQPALAKVLTEDERALQQNQRPDKASGIASSTGVHPNFADVSKDIAQIISDRPDKGPTLVRLAWHSSGTYDKMTKTGGSEKGTIRFEEELKHGANAGLDSAIAWLEPIYKKYNKATDLSYADLYTLAGVVAIQSMGGPKVPWRYGRVDSYEISDVTPDGRLPDADKGTPKNTADHLRSIFNRMGFNDQEIVALSGAHALGRCHATASGYVGPWTPTPTTFNNLYFSLLKTIDWTVNPKVRHYLYI